MAVTSRDLNTGRCSPEQRRHILRVLLGRGMERLGQLRRSRTTGALLLMVPLRALPGHGSNRLHQLLPSNSAGTVVLTALLLVTVFALSNGWAQTKIDDLRYGRPRMDTLTAFVGHEQVNGLPTQLIALNLNRQVMVVEFPGGDPSQMRTIVGPYLFGQQEDLTPVTLDMRDLNGDQRPELLVIVKNEILVYINEPDGFRTMTPEEHQQFAGRIEN
ncbi:MAG: hypothetical protein KatS3mg057_1790 [Herpetosiphonaceae bacterium]|nr:MAG: hypothetical protein KatS3mg057_1790 [Herpetosiphonaceae bacterium]